MSTVPDNTISTLSSVLAYVPVSTLDATNAFPRAKRWTRAEYHRIAELGFFQDERVELINGEILVLTPQSSWHAYALDKTAELLNAIFAKDHWVRLQLPLVSGDSGEPEPDISVVHGLREDFIDHHPTTAALIVEISYTTQEYDTQTKAHLYASMNVPDYWVLDLENRQLLVYRQPVADETAKFGHRYESMTTIAADGQVASLEKPGEMLTVGKMLPPVK
ncbi:MAG: Uma2 family endonuclease [Planctomycetes bacterium]|nr:Uma2 family endonuclease [Planctomycetota bacterium]